MTTRYIKPKFRKVKPRLSRRSNINASDELQKLIKKELQSGIKDLLKKELSASFSLNENKNKKNSATEKQNSFDLRKMEFDIDQMVAASLMGGRQTSGVLRSLFGLVPSLIGR